MKGLYGYIGKNHKHITNTTNDYAHIIPVTPELHLVMVSILKFNETLDSRLDSELNF